MRKITFQMLILVFSLFASSVAFAGGFAEGDKKLLAQAGDDYRNKKYAESAEVYETLSHKYPEKADLFYNLGASLHRLGKTGSCIWAFEKAKTLAPRDKDIQENLYFLKSLLEYKITDKRGWYLKAYINLLEFFTEEEIYSVALFFYFSFLCSWIIAKMKHKHSWGFFRKTLLVFLGLSIILAASKHVESNMFRGAIVIQKNAEVRYGPSEQDQLAFKLPEGMKVYVVENREDWSRILLVNGESGWIPQSTIRVIAK